MTSEVRVRFAPSPTGSLHLGGVRTALYNYLLAKRLQGKFIIRIEDTDLDRNQVDAEKNQLADLSWLGLTWDEGPDVGGDFSPYYQSERQSLYAKYAQQLIKEGKAFYCFLTDEELTQMHSHENRQLKSPYRELSIEEATKRVDAGEAYVVRYKNDHDAEKFIFQDLVHGETQLAGNMVGDFVLIRSNQQPVYNFCCVIDDHLMAISHVLRGEEHLSNTLRQLMLYDAFEWKRPMFGHLSMILGANRKKLSKRDDAVSMKDFIQGGYLPEAILNYVALLGWSHANGEELLQMQDMVSSFSMDRVNKSPAMFDRDKLNWLNHYHLGQMSADKVLQALNAISDIAVELEWFKKMWALIGHQFHTLIEIQDTIALIHHYSLRDKELTLGEGREVINAFLQELEKIPEMNEDAFQEIMKTISTKLSVKGRRLFAPIRVALIGIQSGMELKVLAILMSKEDMVKRVEMAIEG